MHGGAFSMTGEQEDNMITVLGHEIDFDVTAPADLDRYLEAMREMEQRASGMPAMPEQASLGTADGIRAYTEYLRGQCMLLTDFIDAAFGEGTCNKLLGAKTSLDKLMDMVAALREAVTGAGRAGRGKAGGLRAEPCHAQEK